MASRIITQFVSDLSGDEIEDDAGESVEFAYRGTNYSIDLTSKEAAGFDKSVAMYIEHATKSGGARRAPKKSGGGAGESDAKAVREWAREQGIDVPERGRIPADIRTQYDSAH